MKYIASCSFGKDSLAMILVLIEKSYPLDEVVFYDTGKEFQAIYDTSDIVLPLLKSLGIKYTELKPEMSFDYKMFEKPVKKRGTDVVHKYGYSWCGGTCRWGTTDKLQAIERYAKGCVEYVGIAHDEPKRLEKERKGNKRFPLDEWEMGFVIVCSYIMLDMLRYTAGSNIAGETFRVIIQTLTLLYPTSKVMKNLFLISSGKFPPEFLMKKLYNFEKSGDLNAFFSTQAPTEQDDSKLPNIEQLKKED